MNVEAATKINTSVGDGVTMKRPYINDDMILISQQETHPDVPTSRSSNDNAYFNFNLNRAEPHHNNYFDATSQDFLTGLNSSEPPASSNLWQEMATSISNNQYSSEVMDTFDFLIKNLSSASNYISALSRDQAGLLTSIRPKVLYEFILEVAKVRIDRRIRRSNSECAFCRNNGETEECYSSHILKDSRGRVICPVLRAFRCPRCGATGDRAHTIKYCPESSPSSMERSNAAGTAQRRVPPSMSMLLGAGSSGGASVAQTSPTPTSPHNNFSPFAQTNIWSNFRPN